MKILALEPYFGGSHQALLDGWSRHSRHQWTILGLPAYKWKWRMRHAAITLARQLEQRASQNEQWDLLLCSDMLNLAEFRGLADCQLMRLPTVVYFHENQLTYPVRDPRERDYHFAFTNFTTALAADSVWFNSNYHRSEFLDALRSLLGRMPDNQPLAEVERIAAKSLVCPPGIDALPARDQRRPGAMRILWAARWEHDKDPETFFDALMQLQRLGVKFRISVIGEQFRESPAIFERARVSFADVIDQWGYVSSRDQYIQLLLDADVIVSTAKHEFFGLSVVEAISAGNYPVLPRRLSYPELLDVPSRSDQAESPCDALFFYDGDTSSLVPALAELAGRLHDRDRWLVDVGHARLAVRRFQWSVVAPELDRQLTEIARNRANRLSK